MNNDDGTNKKYDEEYLYHLMYLPRGTSRLENLGETKSYPENYELNEINKVPKYCYAVKSGSVLCYEFSYAGEQRIYNIMEKGSLFLEECILLDKPCPILFKTQTPSELIQIDKCALKRALKNDIDLVMDVCESLSTKFLSAMEHLRLGPHQNASMKICKLFLIYAKHYGVPYDGKILIQKKVSQQMFANLLGMNRITVTRKIKELKNLSLIESINGFYCIRSIQQIENHMMLMETE